MSRSFKHTPVLKDNPKGRKFAKKTANRKVRNHKGELANGKAYRKLFCTYDIYDYIFYRPYSDWQKDFNRDGWRKKANGWETEEDCRNDWEKTYYRK